MITRALFLTLGWFVVSFLAVLLRGRHVKTLSMGTSLLWLFLVLAIGDLWALLTFGVPIEMASLTLLALFNGLFWIYRLRDWNSLGQVAWAMTLLATLVFIVYSFSVTVFTPLNAFSYLLAIVFFFVEAMALLLGLTHAFESLDVINRVRWNRARIRPYGPDPNFYPKVSFQVPTYNEPPEVVAKTLENLARMDYPNFEVLVVDNNTPDEANWRELEAVCRRMGPRFRMLHLDKWPGFKSGALNFALTQTAPDAEIVGVVDADYQLDPNFLKEIVPVFRDPRVAFVQTPQDYRDSNANSFAETIYHGYKYFFEVSMPVRNEHNAIIFCGTMGLLRRSVLEEIGGWDEWCITEDAEASLRILKRGYLSQYIHKTYGRGLMPFSFDGLKKQRFRWGFGGIQILRKHWEALMPWSSRIDPTNRLTGTQKYYYLAGGLQWFTDLFNLLFSIFLVIGAFLAVTNTHVTIRPLTGPLIVVPAVFLLLNTWRFLYVLRDRLSLSFGKALRAMFGFFSMGWVTVLADIQGLIQPRGIFLRTEKTHTDSKALQAIQATTWETGLGVLCLAAGVIAFAIQPTINTGFLASLLAWQSSLFLAAPALSLMSAYAGPQPVEKEVPEGAPVRESSVARWAVAMALAAVVAVLAIQLTRPPATTPPYAQYQPPEVPAARLYGGEQVPLEKRSVPPTPDNGPAKGGGNQSQGPSKNQPTPTETQGPKPAKSPTLAPTPAVTLTPASLPSATVPPAFPLSPTPTAPAIIITPPVIATPTPFSTATPLSTVPATVAPSPTAVPMLPSATSVPVFPTATTVPLLPTATNAPTQPAGASTTAVPLGIPTVGGVPTVP